MARDESEGRVRVPKGVGGCQRLPWIATEWLPTRGRDGVAPKRPSNGRSCPWGVNGESLPAEAENGGATSRTTRVLAMTAIYLWPTWATIIVVVLGVTVPAVVGHIVTRRIVPYSDLAKHNDVTGFVLAIVGWSTPSSWPSWSSSPGRHLIPPMDRRRRSIGCFRSLSSRRDLQRAEPWRATPRDRALCRSRAARGVDGDADGPRVG